MAEVCLICSGKEVLKYPVPSEGLVDVVLPGFDTYKDGLENLKASFFVRK